MPSKDGYHVSGIVCVSDLGDVGRDFHKKGEAFSFR